MRDYRPIVAPINMVVSVLMYIPHFRKILSAKDTHAYSVVTALCIFLLQASSFLLAVLEGARYLSVYYTIAVVLTSVSLGLIVRYRHGA